MPENAETWQDVLADEGAFDERLTEALEVVRVERDRNAGAREEAAQAVRALDERIKRADRILRAAGLTEQQQPRRDARARSVSDKTVERVAAVIAESPDGAAVKEISQATSIHPSAVRIAVAQLREDQVIRQAGKRRLSDHGQAALIYKPMALASNGTGE